ncbi:MAG: hypothetical protein JW861_10690 [Bacteroidales bacterium]|nr:hypothetical protein [Bacteroidales bacterium]
MKTDGFQRYIFSSYSRDADLPEVIIARQVILFGEFGDMILMTRRLDRALIQSVLNSLKQSNRFQKRINFVQKVILDE